jgi:steroid 5-alpha reductase family enzyme
MPDHTTPRPLRWDSLSRPFSIFVCCVIYAAAAVVAWAVSAWCPPAWGPVAMAAAADLAATIAVFAFSVLSDNSSVYDPYWSVAPLGIALYWALHSGTFADARQVLVVLLVVFWSLRLTANWLARWQGLGHEDWRYADFRASRLYWPISLAGFHLFPTVAVFLGCLPLVPVLLAPARSWGLVDGAAAVFTVAAILTEMRADQELRRFLRRRRETGELLTSGVWSLCRHPNYLGEVGFWWGVAALGVAANPAYWWTTVGAIVITALFAFVSVPMMDRHMLKRYQAYARRMEQTPAMLPGLTRLQPDSRTARKP